MKQVSRKQQHVLLLLLQKVSLITGSTTMTAFADHWQQYTVTPADSSAFRVLQRACYRTVAAVRL
jgi:hypothetical protein